MKELRTVTLKLSEDRYTLLAQMAAEVDSTPGALVQGMVELYLNGKVRRVAPPMPRRDILVNSVLAAVARYQAPVGAFDRYVDKRMESPVFAKAYQEAEEELVEPFKASSRSLLSESQKAECRRLKHEEGMSYGEIADHFGVSVPTVRRATGSLKRSR